jgi:hypothetical protein
MKKRYLIVAAVLLLLFTGCMSGYWTPGGGYGFGMMGAGGGYGFGMTGPGAYPVQPGTEQLTMVQAADAVNRYLGTFWGGDLVVAEVMEFDNHFYAAAKEKSSGIYAFEVLVDKWTGAVVPEPGPNMMWNTKYGHMGAGMMGGGMMGSPSWGWGGRQGFRNWSESNKDMSVSPEAARKYAQEFLDQRLPGTQAEDDADAFYGYYTLHVERDGKTIGMLGVNGYTGWVWYHEWHGKFIGMKTEFH